MSLRILAATAVASLVAALTVAGASAAVYIHGGNMFGNVLASGTTLSTNTINGTSVLTTSVGNLSCTAGSASGTVGASGGTSVTATLTSLVFGSTTSSQCTDTIPFIVVQYCDRYTGVPATVTVTGTVATPVPGTTSPASQLGITGDTTVVVDCHLNDGLGHCYFQGSGVNGQPMSTFDTATNSILANSIKFSNVPVTQYTTGVANVPGCPTTGSFSVEFTAIKDNLGRLADANNNP